MRENAHRGGLAIEVGTIWPQAGLFQRLGERAKLCSIIDDFYHRLGNDPVVRALFADALQGDRAHQKMFFEEWMGGEARYSREVGGPGMRSFHEGFHITRAQAGRWLALLTTTLREHGILPEVIREILQVLGPMAQAFTRRDATPLSPRVRRAAASNNVESLRRILERDSRILARAPREASHCLFRAARAGHFEMVSYLADIGVDVNRPFSPERTQLIPWHIAKGFILITPWCVAKVQGHEKIADFLRSRGAEVDVFSLAYLGDVEGLRDLLDRNIDLAICTDPATDHRRITPLHHAIWAGQRESAELLRSRGAEIGADGPSVKRKMEEQGYFYGYSASA